jgi:hypothetical protein
VPPNPPPIVVAPEIDLQADRPRNPGSGRKPIPKPPN